MRGGELYSAEDPNKDMAAAAMKGRLVELEARDVASRIEVSRYRAEAGEHARAAEQLQRELGEVRRALRERDSRIVSLTEEAPRLQERLSDYEEQEERLCIEGAHQAAVIEAERAQHLEEVAGLQGEWAASKRIAEALRQEVHRVNDQLLRAEDICRETEARVAQSEAEKMRCVSLMDSLQAERDALSRETVTLQEKICDLSGQHESSSDRENEQREVDRRALVQMELRCKSEEARVVELEAERTTCMEELSALQAERAGFTTQIEGLREQVRNLGSQLACITQREEERSAFDAQRVAELEVSCRQDASRVANLETMRSEMLGELDTLRAERDASSREAEVSRQEIKKMASQHSRLSERERDRSAADTKRVAELEAQRADLLREVDALQCKSGQGSNHDRDDAISSTNGEQARLLEEVQRLRQEVAEATAKDEERCVEEGMRVESLEAIRDRQFAEHRAEIEALQATHRDELRRALQALQRNKNGGDMLMSSDCQRAPSWLVRSPPGPNEVLRLPCDLDDGVSTDAPTSGLATPSCYSSCFEAGSNVGELQAQIVALQNEGGCYAAECEVLQEENRRLRLEVDSQASAGERSRRELASTQQEVEQLRADRLADLTAADAAIASLRDELLKLSREQFSGSGGSNAELEQMHEKIWAAHSQ